jgi:thermitase
MRQQASRRSRRGVVLLIAALVCLLPLVAPPRLVQAQGRPEFVEDELLVQFKRHVPPANEAAAHGQATAQVVREVPGLDVKVVKVPPQRLAHAFQSYQSNPNVAYVERNGIAYAGWTPDDSSFGQQWSLNNTGLDGGTADADIDAPEAWDVAATANAAATVISIVDTGIDHQHPDLAAKIPPDARRNWYDGGPTADVYGHGTHVAGIAAANTNNETGIAGVCPDCGLLNAKVCSDAGSCPYDRIANGVLWSVGCELRAPDRGPNLGACQGPIRAQVINMSIAGSSPSMTLQKAMDRAADRGATMACAAGNAGTTQAMYPAFYSNCIAVAATTNQDQRASFSTYGTWVDVAAPGANIYSTLIGGQYGLMSGTSMASPHVAGLAGLLRSRGIVTTRDAIRSRIESAADPITGTGSLWAKGRINACRGMKNAPSC